MYIDEREEPEFQDSEEAQREVNLVLALFIESHPSLALFLRYS